MKTAQTYFLVNDTRYDNHFGGLTVIKNLHAGMTFRGAHCTGSLPVSSSSRHLKHHRRALRAAQRVIINGEGSLHHNSRNTRRLLKICRMLAATHPMILVNTVWQDNDPAPWLPLLRNFLAVYARDRRSQSQFHDIGIDAEYAPDLTFYAYPSFPTQPRSGYLCTDSVVSTWTEAALKACQQDEQLDFMTLFTRSLRYRRGSKDWHKALKYRFYPILHQRLGVRVPPRYRSLPYAVNDIGKLLQKLAACQAVCAARYHSLCFALQQNSPFAAVTSNSHKSISLLEEIGIPPDRFTIKTEDMHALKTKLKQAEQNYAGIESRIEHFKHTAKTKINSMFDHVAGAR